MTMRLFFSGAFRCAVNGIRLHSDKPVDLMLSYLYLRDNPAGQDQLGTLSKILGERGYDPLPLSPRKQSKAKVVQLNGPVNCRSHFLDSGAFSQRKEAIKFGKKTGKGPFAFYGTKGFWEYVDSYCEFVKRHRRAIDYFVNVDVIPNADLTWKVQNYIEKTHGLRPVPVVHGGSDLKWLGHYVDRGHKLIALGGLSSKTKNDGTRRWIDAAFAEVCKPPHFLPSVRLHGFGLSTFETILGWPWWSVDSSTWTSTASYGGIFVPVKRGGQFDFTRKPYVVRISETSPDKLRAGSHYQTMSRTERKIVEEWLEVCGVPLGEMHDGDIKSYGVVNRHSERRAVNYMAFEAVRKAVPSYPWAFRPHRVLTGGLGIVCQ